MAIPGGLKAIRGESPDDFLIYREGSGNTVEIFDIVVNSVRRQGKGRQLVYKLYEMLPRGTNLVWAITRASNQIAQQFYEELNFRVIGVLRNFYNTLDEDGNECVDAIMYGRDVAEEPKADLAPPPPPEPS